MDQIASFKVKIGMALKPHPQEQVTAFSAPLSRFSLAGQPDALAISHPKRNFHLIGFHLIGT